MADRFRTPRRPKQWSASNLAGNASFTGNATSLVLAAVPAVESVTVLRLRGEIFVGPSGATTALDQARVAFGIGIVTSDAAAVGSTAMPDPDDEPDFPWLWYHLHNFFSGFTVDGTASDDYGVGTIRIDVDSKAMRKMKPGQSIVGVAQYVDVVGTPTLRVGGSVRMLLAGI